MPQGAASSTGLATDMMYAMLQQSRALSHQAIGALAKYDADSSAHLRGELYAQEAYAEVWLADLFCSGVPLTTSDFQGDFTYKPSSTSEQVYAHAVALFDTALTLAGDSIAVADLAKIGRARAHLAVGQYAAAALDVDGIPVGYQYRQFIQTCGMVDRECGLGTAQAVVNLASIGSMADREGGVGLPYRSSDDPRTAPLGIIGTVNNNDVWFPAKYTLGGFSAIVPASGIEAQLIAAEADLHGSGATWLTTLNALRTTGVYTGVDTLIEVIRSNPVDTAARDTTFRYDTAWVAGTGGVGHLGPLRDPGTPDGRIDLVFRERAFWLYLSGVRQGDLRRLVRTYRRPKNTLYPGGTYPGVGSYRDYIDAPIPTTGAYSETPNPYYRGCLSRD
jgi:hypothetical protein